MNLQVIWRLWCCLLVMLHAWLSVALFVLLVDSMILSPQRTSFNISCKASLLVTIPSILNFCLRNSLFPSLLKDKFTEYRILGWWFSCFHTSLHSLACRMFWIQGAVFYLPDPEGSPRVFTSIYFPVPFQHIILLAFFCFLNVMVEDGIPLTISFLISEF